MATKQADDFLATLKALGDIDLATALAADPDLIKKAQKAIKEAQRIEAETAKKKSEEAAASAGVAYDAKSWAKAKRLLTNAYNATFAVEFQAAMAKTDANISPEGEPSLLVIAMDYLAEKSTVELMWPKEVLAFGARIGEAEISSMFKLFAARGGVPGLGAHAKSMLIDALNLNLDWSGIEAKLAAADALDGSSRLIDFARNHLFARTQSSDEPRAWNALENLARAGCKPFDDKIDKNSYGASLNWESLCALGAKTEDAMDAKASAFQAFIERGWCDRGITALGDGLAAPAGAAATGRGIENCGSRSALNHLPMERASVDIFAMLCERESEIGFSRYDAVGRSRLYFVNEKIRQNSRYSAVDPEHFKIFAALAEKAMELGDPPESVNAQNPIAKCASKFMADVIGAAIEKRDIQGAVGAKGATARAPSRSL